jgi:hypothetical protein
MVGIPNTHSVSSPSTTAFVVAISDTAAAIVVTPGIASPMVSIPDNICDEMLGTVKQESLDPEEGHHPNMAPDLSDCTAMGNLISRGGTSESVLQENHTGTLETVVEEAQVRQHLPDKMAASRQGIYSLSLKQYGISKARYTKFGSLLLLHLCTEMIKLNPGAHRYLGKIFTLLGGGTSANVI